MGIDHRTVWVSEMQSRNRKIIIFCVLWTVVVVVAVAAVRSMADPQRKVDSHLKAMRPIFEELKLPERAGATQRAQIEWNRHANELVRLGYLVRVEYSVPLRGDRPAQERLYAALEQKSKENWISDWTYRSGTGAGVIITVKDVPERQNDWKPIIDRYGVPME